jgi:hypothetical protein
VSTGEIRREQKRAEENTKEVSNAKTQKRKDRKGASNRLFGSSLRSLQLCAFALEARSTVHIIEQCNQL